MSDLGPINLGPQVDVSEMGRMWYEPASISPDMAAKVDHEIKKILDNGYKKAVEILKEKRSKLDLIADTLVKEETIDGEGFERLMKFQKTELKEDKSN